MIQSWDTERTEAEVPIPCVPVWRAHSCARNSQLLSNCIAEATSEQALALAPRSLRR